MAKTKVEMAGEFSPGGISRLIEALRPARIDTQDGVKAVFDDGWFHIRVSNTEGVVRVMAESMSEARTEVLLSSARDVLAQSWGAAG